MLRNSGELWWRRTVRSEPAGIFQTRLWIELLKAFERTPAQVLLRWCLQHDTVVLTKSTQRERIQENAAIFDFRLSDDDMSALDELDCTGGTDRALERRWW